MTNRSEDGESTVIRLLLESRERERAQTRFYRVLAALAESVGDPSAVERLNELHADEQHHLSRITARLLELGAEVPSLLQQTGGEPTLDNWEVMARKRESEEIAWYDDLIKQDLDPQTQDVVEEILDSERHHHDELRGKWMPA